MTVRGVRTRGDGPGHARRGRHLALLLVPVVVIAAVACLPARPVGNATSAYGPDPSGCPNFQPVAACGAVQQASTWLSLNGPYAPYTAGDPFTTKCTVASGSGSAALCDDPAAPNGAKNPLYRSSGYDVAIEVSAADVAAGAPLNLQVWDAITSTRVAGPNATTTLPGGAVVPTDCPTNVSPFNSATYQAGGRFAAGAGASFCQTGDVGSAQNLDIQLWSNDGNDNTVVYTSYQTSTTGTPCHRRIDETSTDATYKNKWVSVCTFMPTIPGIYPLRLRNSGIGGLTDRGDGRNDLALRVTGAVTSKARIYSLRDSGLFLSAAANPGRLYLTEIPPADAGKLLTVDLFDAGDVIEDGSVVDVARTVRLQAPAAANGATPLPAVPSGGTAISNCSYNVTPAATRAAAATVDHDDDCTIPIGDAGTSTSRYDGAWLRIQYRLPTTYDCGPAKAVKDCWWTLRFDDGPLAADRFTMAVTVAP